jgi:PAS domain S-box-containing protein
MDYRDLPREALIEQLEVQLRERAEYDRVVQELATHQIELEAQNQALREAQGQIEESRSRYADLYDFAPIAYCTFDRNGVVLEINLTGASILGAESARIIGRPFRTLARLDDPEALIAHIRAALESAIPTVGEINFSTPRSPRVVQLVSAPERDLRGPAANKRDGAEFTEDDQMAIEMFAERVGVALEIARLRQIEAREHTRLELLARAGPLLAEPTEYDTTLGAVEALTLTDRHCG